MEPGTIEGLDAHERLARFRKDAKLTQRSLATKSGVHYVTIANLEADPAALPRANLETLRKLAAALGREIADFLPKASKKRS